MRPRESGRAVRQINTNDLTPELNQLENVLHNALIEAPHDPAELIRAIGIALRHAKRAKWSSQETEATCEKAAQRGAYKKARMNGNE